MRKIGVLMIHGTFGSPREFFPLESYLRSQGLMTRAIALPGHGPRPRKLLSEVTAEEILECCYKAYDEFSKQCDYVYLVGQSLGGLCSLVIASEQPKEVAGVIALSAPYEHAYFVNYSLGLFKFPFTRLPASLYYAPESFTALEYPEFYPWWYPILYQESAKLFDSLQDALPRIELPVLLAHSPYDLIVPFEEMDKIYRGINKPELIETYELDQCGHQIFPYSRERERVTRLIWQFIHQLEDFQDKAIS